MKEKSDEPLIFIYENKDGFYLIEYCKDTLKLVTLKKNNIKFEK
ncbi:hypothetical protein [Sebaldella sp. S0638]|nr:hypothetical protein [Sebaldella sp. S0638]